MRTVRRAASSASVHSEGRTNRAGPALRIILAHPQATG